MNVGDKYTAIANRLRKQVQRETKAIDEGEGVAMILLWSFLMDHAQASGMDVEQLARAQLEAFIIYARKNVHLSNVH